MKAPLRLVTATRYSKSEFWEKSLLGRSLSMFPDALLPELAILFDNRDPEPPSPDSMDPTFVRQTQAEGLPSFYNRVIHSTDPDTNLLFVHDDVFIHDVFVKERLVEAFRRFDVVGLAGSRLSDLSQPSWGLRFSEGSLDFLGWQEGGIVKSGAVSHLNEAYGHDQWPEPLLSLYGPSPDFCTLLDGLFLAVRTQALLKTSVRFDPRFHFHLYDIDFCRAATEAGILLGTWPILVTHGSGGNFASSEFKAAARSYLAKWNARQFERALGFDSSRLVRTTG